VLFRFVFFFFYLKMKDFICLNLFLNETQATLGIQLELDNYQHHGKTGSQIEQQLNIFPVM